MDKYDEAIAYLTEHPSEILNAWDWPSDEIHDDGENHGGCLFRKVGDSLKCGCLTQIRASRSWVAPTPELEAEIRADKRIPTNPGKITPADLPVFAEWQRRLDKELNRV